jgi:hypothetical protein
MTLPIRTICLALNEETFIFSEWVDFMKDVSIPTNELPQNIQDGNWPSNFFDQENQPVLLDQGIS